MDKFLLALPLIVFGVITDAAGITKDVKNKGKILMIIAHSNFRDEEYFVPKKLFIQKGYRVITASSSTGEATGMLGAKVKPDILLQDVNVKEFVAIVFIGGSGSTEYWDSKTAHKLAKEAIAQKKVLAAICLAPATLAKAGILKNKKATVYESAKSVLKQNGAVLVEKDVVVDDNIVTGNGPGAAEEFAKNILKLIE